MYIYRTKEELIMISMHIKGLTVDNLQAAKVVTINANTARKIYRRFMVSKAEC